MTYLYNNKEVYIVYVYKVSHSKGCSHYTNQNHTTRQKISQIHTLCDMSTETFNTYIINRFIYNL